jgi:hypothetical protein
VTGLRSAIAAQPSLKGNTWLGGPTVTDVQVAAVSSEDLAHAELYILPFLVLLLFFVFRGLRAAAIPLVGAVFAIAVTLGGMGLVMLALPLSVFALNLVIALGLGLSVDFTLLIVSRFREELPRQGSVEATLATVRRTAGRTVLFGSVTIAAVMATLAIFPQRFVYSMGISGAIVVLAAGAFALLVSPARPALESDIDVDVAVVGAAIIAGRLRRAHRAPVEAARPGTGQRRGHEGAAGTGWRRSSCAGRSSGRRRQSWCWWSSPCPSRTSRSPALIRASCRRAARPAYHLTQANFAAFSEGPAGLLVDSGQVTPARLATYGAAVPPSRA